MSQTQMFQDKLESMTVKELRQILKNSELNQRGILSRLKLKRDLVDFLKENLEPSGFGSWEEAETKILETRHTLLENKPDLSRPELSQNAPSNPMKMPTISKASEKPTSSPKDLLFEKVYARYPSTRDKNCTDVGENDVRQDVHPIFGSLQKSSDLDIVFVGTASCTPGVTRGVSCTALRLNWQRRAIHGVPQGTNIETSTFMGGTWVFDCGECTQLQVQRTSAIKPGKITKIFLTHAHGDHSFGLPGLLCMMGQDRDRTTTPPVDIYGPEGLRMWLRVAIRYSVSRIVPNYRVHELKDIPMAPEWEFSRRLHRFFYKGIQEKDPRSREWGYHGLAGEDPLNWISKASMMNLEPSILYGEIEEGRDIYPTYDHPKASDNAPVWEVEDEDDVKVYAAPMSHGIPCVGYVVEERSKPGRLRDELVKPIVERNTKALKDAGFKIPMKAMAVIKNLPVGSAFTFPDGTVMTQEEAVEPPRKGRKIVICGDTANARAITGLAMDADVVIHEATNSYLSGLDKETNLRAVTRDTIVHGHSTPYMAGEFAKRVRAKRLVLNHFSARYRGDQSVDSLSIMMRIEGQAIKASGLTTSDVAAAWDYMVMPIPQN